MQRVSDRLDRDRPERVQIGALTVNRMTFSQALDAIEDLVRIRQGGAVFTPNVDHVVLAEDNPEFRQAYSAARLSLADGMPLVWASRLLGRPIPEKVSGSDLLWPLLRRAAAGGFRVYLLGGAPGVAEKAAEVMRSQLGVNVVGVDAPTIADPLSAAERAPVVEKLRRAAPDLVLVAFGAPKQETFIHAALSELGPAVALGIGAGLDFIAGTARRAPRWMSNHGLEWLFRLLQEPRRLWRRYLVRDPKFALILWRTFRTGGAATDTAPVRRLPRVAGPG
jgi:N-acetylglucosaminyldiphosphoundecaprenol N-acetyl-beta-D-mannosaminyltransferase